jgi:hypothetical protein
MFKSSYILSFVLLVCITLGTNSLVFAQSNECNKAINAAKESNESNNLYDRFLAAESLKKAGEPIDFTFLLRAVDPQTPFLARSATATIVAMNDMETTEQLVLRAKTNADVENFLIEALQYNRMDGVEDFIREYLLNHAGKFEQIKAMKVIARSENKSFGHHLKKTYNVYSDEKLVQAYALYAIIKLHIKFQNTRNKVLVLAGDTDPFVKEMAAVILGELAQEASVNQLSVLMKDSVPRVSITALASYIKVTNGGKQSKLIDILRSNDLPGSEIAAGSLKRLPATLALNIIKISLHENTNIKVSLRMMESIANLKGGDAKSLFQWGLNHKNEDMVTQTLFAIGTRSEVSERDLLVPFLDSKNAAFKSIASWAYLKQLC